MPSVVFTYYAFFSMVIDDPHICICGVCARVCVVLFFVFCSIHHIDLFRLNGPDDVHILGIPSIFLDTVCLVEWPCRLGNEFTPNERLEVCINMTEDEGPSSRIVELRAYGEWWRESVEMAYCNSTTLVEQHLTGSRHPRGIMRPDSHTTQLPPWMSMTKFAHVLWDSIVKKVLFFNRNTTSYYRSFSLYLTLSTHVFNNSG